MKRNTLIKGILAAVLIITAIVVIALVLTNNENEKKLNYDGPGGFLELVEKGDAAAIYSSGSYSLRVLKKGSEIPKDKFPSQYDYIVTLPSRTVLADDLRTIRERKIADGKMLTEDATDTEFTMPEYESDDPSSNSTWMSLIVPILALVMMVFLVFYIMRQASAGGGKAMSFGKTKARVTARVKERFTDVAGAEEEKLELAEVVEFLKAPQKFKEVGARIPKGVLLVGPPGTGKTLFAKAVAGEAEVPFFSISGSDFVEMFVGTGAARVRDLFEQAKHNMPCIVFIDEIDAVGRQRGAGLGGGNDEREQTLNQLLVQMDGFESNFGIIIIAATNRADILDPALMRPGRFDRQIFVHPPDVKGREDILKVHARNKPLAEDVSFKVLARMTSGFTGADLENLLNESAILAARADRKTIVMEDILEGINKVIAGPQKKSRIVTDRDKRITAYHEAGHAIVMKLLPNCDDVQEVSIVPRGMAAGYTLTRPETDDNHITRKKLLDNITGLLGGRAAEEIVIQDISTGASSDIERANGIARKMVTEWGMSELLGNIFLGGQQEVFLGRDYATHANYSENISGLVDNEIGKIIKNCYTEALAILNKNRLVMDNMVKVLFEKETIYTAEVEMLFAGKSVDEICTYIDDRTHR